MIFKITTFLGLFVDEGIQYESYEKIQDQGLGHRRSSNTNKLTWGHLGGQFTSFKLPSFIKS